MRRLPPQAIEVERHVLGALLLGDVEAQAAFDILKPEDFYLERHGLLWAGMRALAASGQPIDLFTLPEALRREGALSQAGGEAVLMEISAEVVSSANVVQHAEIIREKAQLRRLIQGATRILEKAYAQGAEAKDVLAEGQTLMLELTEDRAGGGLLPWDDITPGTEDLIARAAEGKITGAHTGFRDLDLLSMGWQPTEFIIIAGRPAMGKTALGLSTAWRSALYHGTKVGFFSMEMGKRELQQRVFCAHRNLDLHKLRTGKLTSHDRESLRNSIEVMRGLPLHIDDGSGRTPSQILSQLKRMRMKHGLQMAIVDFCQLGKLDKKVDTRAQEVGEFAYALKGIAKDLEIPIIGLAQCNREVEHRKGDELGNLSYKLSDLNESGGLEQAGDMVGFIHRPEVLAPQQAEKGFAQVQWVKHRNGPTVDTHLRFNAESASFSGYIPPNWVDGDPHPERRPRSLPPPMRPHEPNPRRLRTGEPEYD